MAGNKRFRATVIEQVRGTCPAGHKVGDAFEFGRFCPGDLCITAFHAIYPLVVAYWCGARVPWEPSGKAKVSCPDSANIVVFEVEEVSGEAEQ